MVNHQNDKTLTPVCYKGPLQEPNSSLIYINDISRGLNSAVNFFVYHTLLFFVIYDIDALAPKLSHSLINVYNWVFK